MAADEDDEVEEKGGGATVQSEMVTANQAVLIRLNQLSAWHAHLQKKISFAHFSLIWTAWLDSAIRAR